MYMLTCAGGYPIPIERGKFHIVGFQVTADSTAAASRCTFIDSDAFKEVTDGQDYKNVISDLKGIANVNGTLLHMLPEPIKVREGITVANWTNVRRATVYVR